MTLDIEVSEEVHNTSLEIVDNVGLDFYTEVSEEQNTAVHFDSFAADKTAAYCNSVETLQIEELDRKDDSSECLDCVDIHHYDLLIENYHANHNHIYDVYILLRQHDL